MLPASPTPPGPRAPLLLLALRGKRDPQRFLANLVRDYGDVVLVRVGRHRGYLINDPAVIRYVLVDHAHAFSRGFITPAAQRLVGGSLIAIEGASHDRKKRAMAPHFGHERLEFVARAACAISEERAASLSREGTVDLSRLTRQLSLHLAASNIFSMSEPERLRALEAALESALRAFSRSLQPLGHFLDRLPFPSTRRVAASTEELIAMVDREVRERRDHPGALGDLLDVLAQMEIAGEGPDRLTDRELRAEAIDLLTGSHGTLTYVLSWTLYELARAPALQRQAAAQTAEAIGDRAPSLADVGRLTALLAVFQEGLRLHPPAWAYMRRAEEDVNIGPYPVKAGAYIVLAPYVTHRDPRFFTDPLTFDPTRWSAGAKAARQSLVYFPFGAGPRSCIGEGLATTQALIILACLLRRAAFATLPGPPVRDSPIPIRPLGPMVVSVKPRASV